MPLPLSTYLHILNSGWGEVAASPGSETMSFVSGQGAQRVPLEGEVMLLHTSTQTGDPDWTTKADWAKLGHVNDPDGRYGLYAKVSDGTETAITFTAWTGGIYIRAICASFVPHPRRGGDPLSAVLALTAYDGPDAQDYQTPDLGVAETEFNVRSDWVTGRRAVSSWPRPDPVSDWTELGHLGNTANGPSTVGWFARYQTDALGYHWRNPVNQARASLSWLIDVPSGSDWNINTIPIG